MRRYDEKTLDSWVASLDEVCCLWARFGKKALEFAEKTWKGEDLEHGKRLLKAFADDHEKDREFVRQLMEEALDGNEKLMDLLVRRMAAIELMLQARDHRADVMMTEAEA